MYLTQLSKFSISKTPTEFPNLLDLVTGRCFHFTLLLRHVRGHIRRILPIQHQSERPGWPSGRLRRRHKANHARHSDHQPRLHPPQTRPFAWSPHPAQQPPLPARLYHANLRRHADPGLLHSLDLLALLPAPQERHSRRLRQHLCLRQLFPKSDCTFHRHHRQHNIQRSGKGENM